MQSPPTPTVTQTSVPTQTPTPTNTPTPTGTVAGASLSATPTPTAVATQAPEGLESAEYFYDGDSNLVKSVINGITTYYVGGYYEKVVDGVTTTIRKYYFAGATRLAVREDGELFWLLGDHLGSTSVTASADGTFFSELRYTAFGEIRFNTNEMPTDYLFTGQRIEEAGLYFYVARFYDPQISHFVQADTIVPGAGDPMAFNRYAYVKYSPIVYTDPSGHMDCIDCGRGGNPFNNPKTPITERRHKPLIVADRSALQPKFDEIYGGQNAYKLYHQLYEYNQGDFTLEEFIFTFYYHEGTTLLSNQGDVVQTYGLPLTEAYAEGNVRSLVSMCGKKPELCPGGYYTPETIFNYIGQFSETMMKKLDVLGNGNRGGDIVTQFYSSTYDPHYAHITTENFFNPRPDWLNGVEWDRPTGFGNDLDGIFLARFIDPLTSDEAAKYIVWRDGSFFIPTLAGQKEYEKFK